MTEPACRELVELITAYLDDVLEVATRRGFEEHLAACGGCERYLEQFRSVIATVEDLPPAPPSSELQAQLMAVFRDWRSS